MGKLGYASYWGKVYKKNDRARYTYLCKCEARAFVNPLATNEFFKSRLLCELKRVIDLLSDPFCKLFSLLIINYDLIEVKYDRCWSISRRDFVEDAIEEQQVGKISPRAFCSFDSARDPDPKYFREVLENSLSPQEVAKFCDDFLKLLLYNKKQHKDKVPCLVGDANSGKTSLFMPILGLIHHGNVATVTKQKAFNKSMITLCEEEKAEIRSMSLPVLLAKKISAVDTSGEENPEEESDGDSVSSSSSQADRMAHLRDLLEKTQPGCLCQRQLTQMLRTEKHKKGEEERSRGERRRKRADFLRSRGVSNANLSLLPDDLDDPTPSPITRDLERYDQARVAAEEQACREAAREAFQGTWLRSTEKDLKRCCERYQASDDSSERSMLKAYIKQLTGKLRDHHVSLGTFGTAEAVAERRRVCTLLGLLDQRQQYLVTSVAERLPLANQDGDGVDAEEQQQQEDLSIFVTPVPSSSTRQPHPSARSD